MKELRVITAIKFLANNQNIIDHIESNKSLNGFKLKAYTNLFRKGKNLNIEKLKKKKFQNREIRVEDIYDEIYTKEENYTNVDVNGVNKEIIRNSKVGTKNLKLEFKSQSKKKNFHPFLADD